MTQALTLRDKFINQLMGENQATAIKTALPKDVDFDRFTDVIVRAVQEQPRLLEVEHKMSIFLACQRAAQDGLMPDKREGALIIHKTKVGDKWMSAVRWEPMIGGLRKRLATLEDPFDIRAHVVYENDHYVESKGDEESIVHKPAKLGTERGPIVGAYAIATRRSDNERWRDSLNRDDLDRIKAVSASGDNGPWGNWFDEMARKSIAKRLIKTLPIDDKLLQEVIARDNEDYNLDYTAPEASDTAKDIQAEARGEKKVTKKKVAKKVAKKKVAKKPDPKPVIEGESTPVEESENPAPPPEAQQEPVVQNEIFQGIDPGF